MNLRIFGLVLVLSGAFSASAKALLPTTPFLNFDFSFTSDGSTEYSNQPGTITGILVGLQNNADSVPSDVIITSAPADMDIPTGTSLGPFTSVLGSFTVTDGVITAANDFRAEDSSTNYIGLNFDVDHQVNYLQYTTGGTQLLNEGGFAGVTYAFTTAVPEPSQYGLFVFLAVAGFISWRRFSRISWSA